MRMVIEAQKRVSVDTVKAFKSLFVTNALNGDDDLHVSDRIYPLVGEELKKFKEKLMTEESPKDLDGLVKKIIPPKGNIISFDKALKGY